MQMHKYTSEPKYHFCFFPNNIKRCWRYIFFFTHPKWQVKADSKITPIVQEVDITYQQLIKKVLSFNKKLEKRLLCSKVKVV